MGLFSSSKPKYKDKVWKAAAFCLKGMITDAMQLITHNRLPIVVTYFPEDTELVLSFVSEKNVPYFKIDSNNASEISEQSKMVFIMEASLLNSVLKKLPTKQPIDFLFFGHYPLPSKENKVLELFSFSNFLITFYSSLDQPSFEIFGSAQTISLMNTLGVKDEEAIENAMVSKAMQRAREKIESKVKFDHQSNSEKEWFQKNVKS